MLISYWTRQLLQVESGGLEPRPSVSFLFRAAPTGGKHTRKWNLRKRKLQTAERRRNARGRAHVQLYNLKSAWCVYCHRRGDVKCIKKIINEWGEISDRLHHWIWKADQESGIVKVKSEEGASRFWGDSRPNEMWIICLYLLRMLCISSVQFS